MNLEFSSKVICAMPSTGQPWMMQRIKWEGDKSQDLEKSEGVDGVSSKTSAIRCWCISQPAAEFYDWIGVSGKQEEGIVAHMGYACEETSVARVVARHYTSKDNLHRVLLLGANLVK